jgi:hypothetical protein
VPGVTTRSGLAALLIRQRDHLATLASTPHRSPGWHTDRAHAPQRGVRAEAGMIVRGGRSCLTSGRLTRSWSGTPVTREGAGWGSAAGGTRPSGSRPSCTGPSPVGHGLKNPFHAVTEHPGPSADLARLGMSQSGWPVRRRSASSARVVVVVGEQFPFVRRGGVPAHHALLGRQAPIPCLRQPRRQGRVALSAPRRAAPGQRRSS